MADFEYRASCGARARRRIVVPALRLRLLTDRCLSGIRRTRAGRCLGFQPRHGLFSKLHAKIIPIFAD